VIKIMYKIIFTNKKFICTLDAVNFIEDVKW
jgi:hypothetical protein